MKITTHEEYLKSCADWQDLMCGCSMEKFDTPELRQRLVDRMIEIERAWDEWLAEHPESGETSP